MSGFPHSTLHSFQYFQYIWKSIPFRLFDEDTTTYGIFGILPNTNTNSSVIMCLLRVLSVLLSLWTVLTTCPVVTWCGLVVEEMMCNVEWVDCVWVKQESSTVLFHHGILCRHCRMLSPHQMNTLANILVGNPFIAIMIQASLPEGLVVQWLTGYTLLWVLLLSHFTERGFSSAPHCSQTDRSVMVR